MASDDTKDEEKDEPGLFVALFLSLTAFIIASAIARTMQNVERIADALEHAQGNSAKGETKETP